MDHILIAKTRDVTKKSEAKRIRKEGEIPSIVYGNKKQPTPISINGKEFKKQFSHVSESTIITLKIPGSDDKDVLIKQYDYDMVKGSLTHIDFFEISSDKELHAHVEIITTGNCEGVRLGGILEYFSHEVEVACLPKDLPETISLDISNLNIGDSLHVSDLPSIAGVKYVPSADQVILHVAAPRVADESTQVSEEETTEEE